MLEQLLSTQPYYAPAWLNLGVIALGRGQTQHALELAERALKLRPVYPQAQQLKSESQKQLATQN